MRLLTISPAPFRGGAEEYALTVASAAARRGHHVEVALPFTSGTEALREEFQQHAQVLHELPGLDWASSFVSARARIGATIATAAMLRRLRPDVIHLTVPWPTAALPALFAPALLNAPAVVAFQLVPEQFTPRAPSLLYALARRRGQTWVAVSEHGRAVLSRILATPEAVIGVIHNGARLPEPLTSDERQSRRQALIEELGLDRDTRIVLTVGRLDAQKGHADLIEAAELLGARCPDVVVLIAGEGAERGKLEALIAGSTRPDGVRLLGRRNDIPRLMGAADVFAFPSHFEGLPFALVEAMAHELPVVVAAFPGATELVRDRRDGMLVPVGDSAALARSLEAALAGGAEVVAMGASAGERSKLFSESRMIERTLALLESRARLRVAAQ